MARWLVVLVLSVLWMVPASPAQAAGTDFEQQVVSLVNQVRASNGLGPLSVSSQLTTSARSYAGYMASAGFFGHTGPDGSTFISRDQAAGYTGWTFLAENLAAGQGDPQSVVQAWMNSPGHRANILSAGPRETGVGYVYRAGSQYGHYWVQEFGTRPTSAPVVKAPAPAPAPPKTAAPTPVAQRVEASSRGGGRETTAPAPAAGAAADTLARPLSASLQQEGDSLDTLGLPRTGVVFDPLHGQWVQYYQRAVLEWHPENPSTYRVQRRLLGDVLYPGAEPPLPLSAAPPGPYHYFPYTPGQMTGLGHFVADVTRDGTAIHFKEFFDAHGGVALLGYPKEEPKLRNGRWTQLFQAAMLEYNPDPAPSCYPLGPDLSFCGARVQLALLGDGYLEWLGVPLTPPDPAS